MENFLRIPQKRGNSREHGLTEADVAIIECLSRDARMSVSRIAQKLKIPESTVRHRMRRLVNEGILQFAAVTDPLKLGYPVWVWIGLNVEMRRIRDVANRLTKFPEVYFVGITTGGYDIILSAIFRSTEDLLAFLMENLAAIPGITRTSTYQYLAFTKRQMNLPPMPGSGAHRSRNQK
jgi:Lrp/AsnC family transcriptional regulator, regulator for asnA, asnC and gidA